MQTYCYITISVCNSALFFDPKIQRFSHANSNKLKLTQVQVYNANDLSNNASLVSPDLNPEPLARQSLDHELSGPLTPTQVPNPYKYTVTLSPIFNTVSLTHTHTNYSFSFHSIFFLTLNTSNGLRM